MTRAIALLSCLLFLGCPPGPRPTPIRDASPALRGPACPADAPRPEARAACGTFTAEGLACVDCGPPGGCLDEADQAWCVGPGGCAASPCR